MTQNSLPDVVIINQSPRPRLLILGFDSDPELIERLKTLAPTARSIPDIDEVREDEWDALVTDRALYRRIQYSEEKLISPHLSVVVVASNAIGSAVERRFKWSGHIWIRSGHISQELARIRALPERIALLTHEQLEPILKARGSHSYFERNVSPDTRQTTHFRENPPVLEPFIATADGKVLAGRYRRSETSEAWLLPDDTPDIVPWVRAALAEWHELAPDRFPGVPDWSHSRDWMNPTEQQIDAQLHALHEERAKTLAALDAREVVLRGELRDARTAADEYERALLTAQHGELAAAVARALSELDFVVTDADAQAAPDDYLEDLQIEDPDTPDWIALGEVKGYTKGASTAALLQCMRARMRYYQRTATEPNALWYVVNQFCQRDPSTRPLALNGKDDDVAGFARDGGLVIDTVTLFKLLGRVRSGVIDKADARKLLRGATGRLES